MSGTIYSRMRRTRRRRFIETYDFPQALRTKLRSELGDSRQVEIALEGLRAWYLACLYADGELIGMPSKAVDVAWHEMILMSREYHAFCERAFGGYLHHSPDSTLDVPMHTMLSHTLAIVDRNELPMAFTADTDAGLEDGYTWSSSDLRRMRDANLAWSATRPRRRRAGSTGTSTSDGSSGAWWGAGLFGSDGGGGGSDGGGGGGGCGGGGCGGGG